MAGRFDIHGSGNWVQRGIRHRRGIRSPANRGQWDVPRGRGIRSRAGRGGRIPQSRLDIQKPGDRRNREPPSNPDIHSPVADKLGIPDIRKQDTGKRDIRSLGSHTRRPGSRNRCRVEAGV